MTGLAAIAARVQQLDVMSGVAKPVQAAKTAPSAAGAVAPAGDFGSMLNGLLAGLLSGQATAGAGSAGGSGGGFSGGFAGFATGATAVGGDAVAAARGYIGVPYVWGGTDPSTGLDCSGLVKKVYADLGVELPRVSRDQAKAGVPVAGMAQARPGDLLAFGQPVRHIAVYAGDGMMIHAPEPGAKVRLQQVYETPSAIRRVLPGAGGPVAGGPTAAQLPSGAGPYANLFDTATERYGLPPGLLSAVARAESSYDPTAVSSAGARGLMQLMPATAAGLGVDPLNPTQAVDGAARMLSRDLTRFGSVPLALAAYNAGPGAVQRFGGIPPYVETQNYVRRIMASLSGGAA